LRHWVYLIRRQAHARDDDSGIIAAVREQPSADPTCIPIVAKLGPVGKRALVSCQCEPMRKRGRQLREFAGCSNAFGFALFDQIVLIIRLVSAPRRRR
jgi:hypothetical protein